MNIKYVKGDTADLVGAPKDGKRPVLTELLWGDRVAVSDEAAPGGYVKVRARGRSGWIKRSALGDESLLEFYFIDVGQGDGVLIRTPDGRHILVDGGYRRESQPSGKNAADFVDWKFAKEYGATEIKLDAMIASHNDADHYGGLWDLVSRDPADRAELNTTKVSVGAFYHAGVSWWTLNGKRSLGRRSGGKLTDLIGDRDSVIAGLASGANPKLQGNWASFLRAVADLGCPIRRLSHKSGHLPGFGPADGPVAVKVLGPIEDAAGGKPALEYFGTDSQSTNGHSIVLRFDYKNARVLLTGDLNTASQARLMQQHGATPDAFACDVAKSCHHGSEDCSVAFLEKVKAAATVISSGDAESHAHPRPAIVAASACTGFRQLAANDRQVTPLIFSTEILRSHRLGKVVGLEGPGIAAGADPGKYSASYKETAAGALKPRNGKMRLGGRYLVAGLIYGLVNVRTDGKRILCASMKESGSGWLLNTFPARF